MKYITYKHESGLMIVHMFSEVENHKVIANKLGVQPISAGFVVMGFGAGGQVRCKGKSSSLEIESRGVEDELLIKRMV